MLTTVCLAIALGVQAPAKAPAPEQLPPPVEVLRVMPRPADPPQAKLTPEDVIELVRWIWATAQGAVWPVLGGPEPIGPPKER